MDMSKMDVADWAGIATVIITLISAITALLAYIHHKRSSGEAHMHALFREYMQRRIQDAESPSEFNEILRSRRTTAKLYTLEEIYSWLTKRWPRNRKSTLAPSDYPADDSNLAWLYTIVCHILEGQGGNQRPIQSRSYGARFTKLLEEVEMASPRSNIDPKSVSIVAKPREQSLLDTASKFASFLKDKTVK